MLHPHIADLTIELMNSEVPKKKRLKLLESVFECRQSPIIVVSSHQMVTTMTEEMTSGVWDYVILDEGHVIKNPQTKLYKGISELSSKNRLLLTGTPVQNNLGEFWAIMNWATSGRCLGDIRHFNSTIADPIIKGQHPKATSDQRYCAAVAMKLLLQLCKPYLLQRKKANHLVADSNSTSYKSTALTSINTIPEKKEFVVWISLSTMQKTEYRQFLNSNAFKTAFSRTTYPVEVINTLKVLCRHPLLLEYASLKKMSCQTSSINDDEEDDLHALTAKVAKISLQHSSDEFKAKKMESIFDLPETILSTDNVMKGSIKLRILVHMVKTLVENDHRVLIFSQSKLMLQIIQFTFAQFKLSSYKIDGSTTLKERQSIIDDFNSDEETYCGPRICLLTTKACGFGITLTGADRVIIFDPCKRDVE